MARRIKRRRTGPVAGKNWIRAGDTVQIMSGDGAGSRDNPKRAKVLRMHPQDNKVLVEGVNKVFRHVRKSQEHPRGGRIEKEAPIALPKVALVCPSCGAPSRRKVRVEEDGTKVRVCSACSTDIPLPK